MVDALNPLQNFTGVVQGYNSSISLTQGNLTSVFETSNQTDIYAAGDPIGVNQPPPDFNVKPAGLRHLESLGYSQQEIADLKIQNPTALTEAELDNKIKEIDEATISGEVFQRLGVDETKVLNALAEQNKNPGKRIGEYLVEGEPPEKQAAMQTLVDKGLDMQSEIRAYLKGNSEVGAQG